MAAHKLSSFADLAQFRERWSAHEPPSPPPSSSPSSDPSIARDRQLDSVVLTSERAPRARNERIYSRDTQPPRGWVAFLTGPSAGFVSDFGASVLTTVRRRASAFVFRDRASLNHTVNLALGINARLYQVHVLPAIRGAEARS